MNSSRKTELEGKNIVADSIRYYREKNKLFIK